MVLVVLRDERAVIHGHGHVVRERMTRDHDPRRMGGSIARQALDLAREVEDAAHIRILLVALPQVLRALERTVNRDVQLIRDELRDIRDLRIGQVQHAAHITDGALRRHGAEGHDLCHMVGAVAPFHVLDDLAAADIVKVHIDIRHGHALRIEEALEEQVVLQRIDVRDAENIGDDGACRRTAPRPHADAHLAAVIDVVPDDEEIAVVAHAMDDAELIVESLLDFIRNDRITIAYILLAERPQICLIVRIRLRNRIIR